MANGIDRLVGTRARLIRIDCGMSQQSVAMAIGVSFQQIQKYENGANRLSASTLVALCKLFGVAISDFFVDVEECNLLQTVKTSHYDNPQVVHVAKAFSSIANENTRRRILGLITTIAEESRVSKTT